MKKTPKSWLFVLAALLLVLIISIFLFPVISGGPSEAPTTAPTIAPATPEADITAAPTENPTDRPGDDDPTPTAYAPTPAATPEPDNSMLFHIDSPAVLEETEDMGQDYLDKFYFVGDSRTYSYKFYGVLSGGYSTNRVWVPESATMSLDEQSFVKIVYPEDGSQITIRQAVERKKPEYLCIGLGINGMSYMNEQYFKSEYTALVNDIKAISPDTRIVLQSIYPTAGFYERKDLFGNDRIANVNHWICSVAEATGVKYLNVAEGIADQQGNLPDNLQNGGGFHLNIDGNLAVMQYIRTHGWK